jgi:hypothetical protein
VPLSQEVVINKRDGHRDEVKYVISVSFTVLSYEYENDTGQKVTYNHLKLTPLIWWLWRN